VRLEGHERLMGPGAPATPATAMEFWRWAFSDLRQNALRGIFAEWVVARIAGLQTDCRNPWDDCDFVTASGLRIEVKAAAYRQAWHDETSALTKIVFSGLHGRRLEGAAYAAESTYNADLYIFCVLDNRSLACDPFDLRNWQFWLMSAERLARPTPNSDQRRSISLASVIREGSECNAADLKAAVEKSSCA
jgi:hypothetical protein